MCSNSTEKLRQNLVEQQERLLQQLDDLLEVKDEMDDEEYEDARKETMEQIFDVAASLKKFETGIVTLSGQQETQMQLTREAISKSFFTPDVIRMFAKREPEQLLQRLSEKERDCKLGKLSKETFHQEKRELLLALLQLGTKLSEEQEKFLTVDETDSLSHFQPVSQSTDSRSVLEWAKKSGTYFNN